MKNLAGNSTIKSSGKFDLLSVLPIQSERHVNNQIIKSIKEQGCKYIDDVFEIESGTWCLYFTSTKDEIFQLCVNRNHKSDEYGLRIYNKDIEPVVEMVKAESLLTLIEDPDVGIHRLLYKIKM